MKKFNILIIFFSIIIFSSFVSSSDLRVNNVLYYSFDDDDLINIDDPVDLSIFGNDGLNTGTATTGVTGALKEAFSFLSTSSSNIYVNSSDISLDNITIASMYFWVKVDATVPAGTEYIISATDGASTGGITFAHRTDGDIDFQIETYGGNSFGDIVYNVPDTNWHLLGVTYNNSEIKAYADGVSLGNHTLVGGTGIAHNGNDTQIGSNRNIANYFNGDVDEFSLYKNRILTPQDFKDVYNLGVGFNPYNNISNFSITAKNLWNGSSLKNFIALVNGSLYNDSGTGIISTTILNNNINLFNMTIIKEDYFNYTLNNINASLNNSIEGTLYQTNITLNFKFSNGDFVSTPINLTYIPTSRFFNVSNGTEIIFPNEGINNFNVSCNNDIFSPFNITLNLTALETSTYNYTVNETQTVLTFLNANDTTPISNGSLIIYFPSGQTRTLTTNSTGQINFSYIYNNILEFGTYNFTFYRLGFLDLNFSENINSSTIPFSKTYNISRANLIINIYDRETGLLLNGTNISIYLVGSFNNTITTGQLIKNNLSLISGEYTVYAGSTGYKTEVRRFDFTNQENLTVNFYLLNLTSSNYGTLFVTTTDTFLRKITDSTVTLLEYSPTELSYISISECITNINAECNFAIELNTKTYYLRATALIGDELLIAETSQSGEIITTTSETRNLIFYTTNLFTVSLLNNLIYSISESFISNISIISVNFFTYDGTAEEVCIEYFKIVGRTRTSVTGDTYCLISSSALQNVNTLITLNRSNNYIADVYIKRSSENFPLETFSYPSLNSADEVFTDDIKGAIIIISWIIVLALCLYAKNITLFFILAIFLSWGEVSFFPTFAIVQVAVFNTIVSIISIMISRKQKEFN